jgi:hypothetical protein
MSGPVGPSEMRVAIRPIETPGVEPERISALAFKKVFDAFLAALIAADRELHPKSGSSEFCLSHLATESYEFGIMEKQRSPVEAADPPSSFSDDAPAASTAATIKSCCGIRG